MASASHAAARARNRAPVGARPPRGPAGAHATALLHRASRPGARRAARVDRARTRAQTGICLLDADSGRVYELTGLAPEFQQLELRGRFVLKTRSDVESSCMLGATADVVSMTKL